MIRKSYTTNNTFKKNYLLKTSKKKEKETKKETLIKTFNIKFTKNKSKKERCKCKNNKKINKLKKLRRRITSLNKMKEVMKSLRNWVIGRNWINKWINSIKLKLWVLWIKMKFNSTDKISGDFLRVKTKLSQWFRESTVWPRRTLRMFWNTV